MEVYGGSLKFYDTAALNYIGDDIGDIFSNLNGLSRKDRIRYDSPKLAGFTLSTSGVEGPGIITGDKGKMEINLP